MRLFTEHQLVLASHNLGKKTEMESLLRPFPVRILSALDLNVPEPEETEDSFEGNAYLKASACVAHTNKPSLADDSGLVIPALGGQPGVHSGRWAERTPGGVRDFTYAIGRIQEAVKTQVDAHMISVLCLMWPDGYHLFFKGQVNGTLRFPPQGNKGFGYDPIFQPTGHPQTYGEMDPEEKERVSHRTAAFKALVAGVFSQAPLSIPCAS